MSVLDFSALNISKIDQDDPYCGERVADLASKLVSSLKENGYVVLENHGIAANAVSRTRPLSACFYCIQIPL